MTVVQLSRRTVCRCRRVAAAVAAAAAAAVAAAATYLEPAKDYSEYALYDVWHHVAVVELFTFSVVQVAVITACMSAG